MPGRGDRADAAEHLRAVHLRRARRSGAASQVGSGWAGLVSLAWPALFLSLGWNFLEFGLKPPGAEPGELAWGWLICAVVFGLMGGVPLVFGIWGLREAVRGRPRAPGSHWTPGALRHAPRRRLSSCHLARPPTTHDGASRTASSAWRDSATAGDLTEAEFEAAKRATLEEAGE